MLGMTAMKHVKNNKLTTSYRASAGLIHLWCAKYLGDPPRRRKTFDEAFSGQTDGRNCYVKHSATDRRHLR